MPMGERCGGEPRGAREQPVAGHSRPDRGSRQVARLLRVAADERQVAGQGVVVDELPAVGEYRDVPVGQRRLGADHATRQPGAERKRVLLRVGVRTGNRGRPGKCHQVREGLAFQPAVVEHLEVERVDNVVLLTKQQRAVAVIDSSGVAIAAPGVDLLPGGECGAVNDARAVELLQLRHATGDVGLMHRGLVLEDLLLHDEKRCLIETEITRRAARQSPRRPPERCDHRLAYRVGYQPEVAEPGVEGRPDHAGHAGPQQVRVIQEQLTVIAVNSLHDLPVFS